MKKMSNVTIKSTLQGGITALTAAVTAIYDGTKEAALHMGQLVIAGIDEFGAKVTYDSLTAKGIPKSVLTNCERVAEGTLDPRLAFMRGREWKTLARYDKMLQTRVLNKGVEVLLPTGKTVWLKLDNMSDKQHRQVLDYSKPRTKDEQAAFLKAQQVDAAKRSQEQGSPKPKTSPKSKKPYTIKDGKLTTHVAPLTWTAAELFALAAETARSEK